MDCTLVPSMKFVDETVSEIDLWPVINFFTHFLEFLPWIVTRSVNDQYLMYNLQPYLKPKWNTLMKVSLLLKRCNEFFQLILIFTYSITHVSSLSQCGTGLEIRNEMGSLTLQNKCPTVSLDNNLFSIGTKTFKESRLLSRFYMAT